MWILCWITVVQCGLGSTAHNRSNHMATQSYLATWSYILATWSCILATTLPIVTC